MALIGNIRWTDWLGNSSTQRLTFLDSITNPLTAMTVLQSIAAEIGAISAAQNTGISMTIYGTPQTVGVPSTISNLSEKAAIVVQTVDGGTSIFNVPAPAPVLFVPGSGQLITSGVSSLMALLANNITLSDGEVINAGVGESGAVGGWWLSTARSSR